MYLNAMSIVAALAGLPLPSDIIKYVMPDFVFVSQKQWKEKFNKVMKQLQDVKEMLPPFFSHLRYKKRDALRRWFHRKRLAPISHLNLGQLEDLMCQMRNNFRCHYRLDSKGINCFYVNDDYDDDDGETVEPISSCFRYPIIQNQLKWGFGTVNTDHARICTKFKEARKFFILEASQRASSCAP
jgi:hypothetical protein